MAGAVRAHSWRQVRVTSFMRARFAAFIHTTNKKGGTGQSRECKFSEAQGRRRSGSRVKVCVGTPVPIRSEEHTSELQSRGHLVCRLLLEKKKGLPGCDSV